MATGQTNRPGTGTGKEPETNPATPNPEAPTVDAEVTAEKFAEQEQIDLGEGPYVVFTDTARYTHKILDAGDFANAGLPAPGGGTVEWNATNSFRVPASIFEGGANGKTVKRLLGDPAREFVLVDD